MANTWGSLEWGEGNFGEQANITVSVTGIGGNPIAWNAGAFGSSGFGGVSNSIPLSLSEETVTGEINAGWGRLTWGENAWGIAGDVLVTGIGMTVGIGTGTVTAGSDADVTGQQQNLSIGNPFVFTATEIFQNGLPGLTIGEGTADAAPDAEVTGQQLNTSLGNPLVYNRQGWGRYFFGEEEWGASGIWEEVQLNNINLGLGVTSGERETWGTNAWGGQDSEEWGGNYVTEVDILTIASPTGIELTAAEGIVDPSPDATVTGIGMTVGVGLGTVSADANTGVLTGQQVNISQGQAELDAVTIASPTGQQLNTSLNSVVAGASAEVFPTGVQANIALGNVNIQAWQIVDTGSTVSYSEVSTGTSVTWNDIDTAA